MREQSRCWFLDVAAWRRRRQLTRFPKSCVVSAVNRHTAMRVTVLRERLILWLCAMIDGRGVTRRGQSYTGAVSELIYLDHLPVLGAHDMPDERMVKDRGRLTAQQQTSHREHGGAAESMAGGPKSHGADTYSRHAWALRCQAPRRHGSATMNGRPLSHHSNAAARCLAALLATLPTPLRTTLRAGDRPTLSTSGVR
jgi:hypothetical protein